MEAPNQIRYASQALLISISQTPSLAKVLLPSGTTNSKMVQIGQPDESLRNVTQEMADRMNTAIELLMSDMPTFVAFAESGCYSGSQSLLLSSTTEGLNYNLITYLTSLAMAGNGW